MAQNVSDALDEVIKRRRWATPPDDPAPSSSPQSAKQQRQAERRAARLARWRGDPRLARPGASASMALQFGPLHGLVRLLDAPPARRAGVERAFSRPLDEILGRFAEIQRMLYQRADEARAMLDSWP